MDKTADMITVTEVRPKYLNTNDAAAYIGYTPMTLRLSRHEGVIGGVKAPRYSKRGTMVVYALTDLDTWCAQFPTMTCSKE